MTSMSDPRASLLVLPGLVLTGQASGLWRPADPLPFDCASIDRAVERFPELGGDPAGGDVADVDTDNEEADAGEPAREGDPP